MTAGDELGVCPVCKTGFVRSRRDTSPRRLVTKTAAAPPPDAAYPEVSFDLAAVWCPACGWVKSVQSSDLGLHWLNREFDERA